ncbi:polyprenyl synthetase family protein [Lachnospiraceae bacterium NSJ-29]|uniref:Farnesyl diphosphate synthase n=2 Tax=Wansuia hejianensis TaxID=2763667 RepID=A0A926EZV8_9FIRM|nr:polyprenyl synthetase family protein [Wansuia hejianensis]
MEKLIKIIDKSIDSYMDIDGVYQAKIFEAMRYSLFTGGKRLRPIFMIKTYEIFSKDINNVLPFATAIEMIHTYSLIHDDLPSMDNDQFRRGKPTNHMVYGEAMSILAGDGLLNLAFEIMSKSIEYDNEDNGEYKRKIRAIQEISKNSGVQGMIGGQVVDLLGNHENMNRDKLKFMYKAKTAGLFQASVVAGAILGGAKEEEIEILRNFSLDLGLLYQIQDDLMDAEEDRKINKLTFLTYYGVEHTELKVLELTKKVFDSLDQLKNRNIDSLKEVTKLLVKREK